MPDDTPTSLPPLDPGEQGRVHALLRRYGRPTGGISPDGQIMTTATGPTVRIDSGSPTPPYEQLRVQLARQITDRRLPVGTRLPTVRRLAADLGLAVNTVARAYRELEGAGLVETRGRAGTFVSAAGEQTRQLAYEAARTYASTVHALGLDHAEALDIVRAALDHPGAPAHGAADREVS